MARSGARKWLYRFAAVMLVLNALVALNSLGLVHQAIDGLISAREALDAVGASSRAIELNESSFRSLLLTDFKEEDQLHKAAAADLNAQLEKIARATRMEPIQRTRIASLRYLVATRNREFDGIIGLRRKAGLARASGILVAANRQATVNEIRRLVNELLAEESLNHGRAAVASQHALSKALLTFAMTSLIAIGLLGVVGFLSGREIAWRGRAEAAVRRSEEWLAAMVSSISDAVIATDEVGQVRLINPVAQELTGWSLAEAKGKPLDEVFSAIDEGSRGPVESPVGKVLKLGGPVPFSNHTLLIARDGTERPIENCGSPIRGGDGSVAGVVLCFRDVTERARVEAELKASKDEADAANRAKDQFLAVLSHELRTPLTPVLVAISGLLEEDLPETVRPTLEMVHRNIRLESQMIADLLDLSRIARGELRLDLGVVDVHEAIKSAVEMCRVDADAAGLKIRLKLEATAPNVRGDSVRLMQVFWNLIGNATKFAAGGTLLVRSRNSSQDGSLSGGTKLFIEFEDDGIGIEPGLIPRIFTPFEQGEEGTRRKGLGLGLAISKRVIDAHCGRLDVVSSGRGHGATFRIELAATEIAPTVNPPQRHPEREDEPGPLRILAVEDNKDTLQYLALVLRKRGHKVRTAESLASAAVALSAEPFDLLISDIELPDGTGLELMSYPRKAATMAGIAFSGFGSEEDTRLSLKAGFSVHLSKPVAVRELDEAIARAMAAASRTPGTLR